MRNSIPLVVVVCLLLNGLKAQEYSKGDVLFNEAKTALDSSRFEIAEKLYTEALAIFKTEKNWFKINYAYHELAVVKGTNRQFEASLENSKKGIAVVKKHLIGRDSLLAEHYINVALVLNKLGAYQPAFDTLKTAVNILKKELPELHDKVVTAQRTLGNILSNLEQYEASVKAYNKGLKLLDRMQQSRSMAAATIHNNLAHSYSKLKDIENQKKHYLLSLAIKEELLPSYHSSLGIAYMNTGLLFNRLRQERKGLQYIKKGFDIIIKAYGPDNSITGIAYNNLGFCASKMGDMHQAKDYYLKALEIFIDQLGEDHQNTIQIYNNIGQVYVKLQTYDLALNYLTKAMEGHIARSGRLHSAVGLTMLNIADLEDKLGRTKEAESHFLEVIEINKAIFGETYQGLNEVYTKLGEFYLTNGDKEKAQASYYKSLKMSKQKTSTVYGRQYSAFSYSKFLAKELKYDSALVYIQGAIIESCENFNNPDYLVNPAINQFDSNLFNAKMLVQKAKILEDYYQSKPDINLLEAALSSYLLAEDFLLGLRKSYMLDDSKILIGKDLYPVYEGKIRTYNAFYENTKDPKYIEKAFAVATFSKSLLLHERIKASNIYSFAGVPDSIIEKREDMIAEINYYDDKIQQTSSKKDSLLNVSLERKRFDKNVEFGKLIQHIKVAYPHYFDILYNPERPSLESIKTTLTNKNTAVLEYFAGKDDIYVFLLSKNKLVMERIVDDINTPIAQFRKSLTNFLFISGQPEAANNALVDQGRFLYQLLVKKVLSQLDSKVTSLIIIPDGILGHLPFGLLLESSPEKSSNYAAFPYLLKRYSISYAYSSSHLVEKYENRYTPSRTFAGFAPSYPAKLKADDKLLSILSRDGEFLNELPNTSREVTTISSLLEGDHWLGEKASEATFKKHAADYSILHLSMHGILNDEDPALSRLIFTNVADTVEDNQLHATELYNMKLNASMAVISACNSGIGKISKGEGMMSLSRAFAYAGVPATIMSLWAVPDESTADLMISFYKQIKSNKSKDNALREAKLEYLSTVKDPMFSHPYFWGGFVPIGDMAALETESNWQYWILSLIVALAACLVLLNRKFNPN